MSRTKPPRIALPLFAVLALLPSLAHAAELSDTLKAALARGSFAAYVLVFLGGVLTSLTPCVYPMIPITLGIFGARGKQVQRGRAMALAATYVAGIGVMYAGLGVSFALAGKAFGTFMASGVVVIPIAVLFCIMAASMFGAFELSLPSWLQERLSSVSGAGFGHAFTMGLVGGIIAAPCTGPVLASVLAYVATTRSVLFGGSLLFTYAVGMGMLFFVLAASAASLPKSGRWMESVKSVFGVVMLLAALYFLRNVVRPLAHYGDWHPWFLGLNLALVAVGVALGAVHLSFHDGVVMKVRKGLGVTLAVVGGAGVIAWTTAVPPMAWIAGEQASLTAARAAHKPLLLDFGADWCLPCRELEVKTFADEKVRREHAGRWVTGRVDCTEDDDAVQAVKKKYGADTLPTVVLLDGEGNVAARWNRVVEPLELLEKATAIH